LRANMNQKFNAWLCRNFDREKTEKDSLGRTLKIPRKGYVTFWDIVEVVIIEPLILFVVLALILFIVLAVPGGIIVSLDNIPSLSSMEIVNALIYGLLFWIAAGIFFGTIYVIYKLMQYKVAVCPLAENKTDDGIKRSYDPKLRPDLKEAEDKMFADILKDN